MEEVGSLNNKIVCAYCGTIYDDNMEKCPLCGSAPKQETKPGKKEKKAERSDRIPKPLLKTSVALLALSVLIFGWFILGQYFPKLDIIGRAKQQSETKQPKTVECQSVSVAENPLTFTEVGRSIPLTITRIPADCTEDLIISSADTSVVTVDAAYNVTAVAPGTTVITVSCGVCRLDVPVEVTKLLAFEQTQLTFDELDQKQTLVISGISEKDFVDWTTTDRSVAWVNEHGEVTAVGNGTCKILATVEDITLSANIKVEAEPEPTEPEPTEPEQTERIGTLNTDGVNVRSGPGKEYDPVSYCTYGERITVLEMDGEWCKIKTSMGIIGYIMDKFIHYEN